MTMRSGLSMVALLVMGVPLFAWDLKPDPPAAVQDWKPIDGLAISVQTPSQNLRLADLGGPFVAVDGYHDKSPIRQVIDLRTGKSVGEVPRGSFLTISAIDPTGTTLAAISIKNRGELLLFDVPTGKEITRVALGQNPSSLRFLSADRLLAHAHLGKQQFSIVDVRKGTVLKTFEDASSAGDSPAVSPGGKYFATGFQKIQVFDLETGTVAATLPMEIPWLCKALAFSADGKCLAAIQEKARTAELVVWSLEDGKVEKFPIVLTRKNPPSIVPPLKPVRSGGWFIEEERILDRTGKLVRTVLRGPGYPLLREALNETLVIGLRLVPGLSDSVLCVVDNQPSPIPGRQVGPGGLKSPLAFPRLTQADLGSVKSLPARNDVAWNGPLDTAPARQPKFPFSVPADGFQLEGLHISLDSSRACVVFQGGKLLIAETGSGKSSSVEVPRAFRIRGDSLDGQAWPMTDGEDRVDVYDASGKHLSSWQPPGASKLVYAATMGNNRAATVMANGDVTLWEQPTCKAIWTTNLRSAEAASLSPGGKQLLVMGGGRIVVLDVATGATHGVLPLEPSSLKGPHLLAVRPDGKELACLVPGGIGFHRVLIWNLETGKLAASFTSGVFASSARYCSNDHLVAGRSVIDFRRKAEVWNVQVLTHNGQALLGPSDGRIWYAAKGARPGELSIVPGEFPATDVDALTTEIVDSPDNLLKPGSRVRVEVRFDRPPIATMTGEATTAIEKSLRQRGFVPDPAGEVVFRVTGTKQPTGKKIQITDSGIPARGVRRSPIETLSVYDVEMRTELLRDNAVFWSSSTDRHSMNVDRLGSTITIPDDKMTAAEYFGRQVWGKVVLSASSPFLCPVTFASRVNGEVRTLPGRSLLNSNGISTQWPAGYSPKVLDQAERAPAEREAFQQAQEDAQVLKASSGGPPLWVIVAGAGCVGFTLIGALLFFVLLKRSANRREAARGDAGPPPLPRRRPRD